MTQDEAPCIVDFNIIIYIGSVDESGNDQTFEKQSRRTHL